MYLGVGENEKRIVFLLSELSTAKQLGGHLNLLSPNQDSSRSREFSYCGCSCSGSREFGEVFFLTSMGMAEHAMFLVCKVKESLLMCQN